jgi:uncharacterized membrane protein YgcG
MSNKYDPKGLYSNYKQSVRAHQLSKEMPVPDLTKAHVDRKMKTDKDRLINSANIYYRNANAEPYKNNAERNIVELEALRNRASAEGHFDVANQIDHLLEMATPVVRAKMTFTEAAAADEAAKAEAARRRGAASPGRHTGGGAAASGGGGGAGASGGGGGAGASGGGGGAKPPCANGFCPKAASAAWDEEE